MPSPPPTSPVGRGILRRTARALLAALAFAAALGLGLALFAPWEIIWPQALARAFAGAPRLAVGWRSLEQASALGFTLRGLSVNATGRFAAEAESLALRLTLNPVSLAGLTVRSGRAALHLDQARIELGLSPLATLRLTAGEELSLSLIRRRTLVITGRADLAALLPESRLKGLAGISADLTWEDWGRPPTSGAAEFAAETLTLPDGRTAAGIAASATLEADLLTLRELRLREPAPLRGRGNARLAWGNLAASTYEFSGLLFPGTLDQEIRRQGSLYDVFNR